VPLSLGCLGVADSIHSFGHPIPAPCRAPAGAVARARASPSDEADPSNTPFPRGGRGFQKRTLCVAGAKRLPFFLASGRVIMVGTVRAHRSAACALFLVHDL